MARSSGIIDTIPSLHVPFDSGNVLSYSLHQVTEAPPDLRITRSAAVVRMGASVAALRCSWCPMIPEDLQAAQILFAVLRQVEAATGCDAYFDQESTWWTLGSPTRKVRLVPYHAASYAWFAQLVTLEETQLHYSTDDATRQEWRETPDDAQRKLTLWIIDALQPMRTPGSKYTPATRVRWSPRPGFPWEGIVVANPGYPGIDGRWRATIQFGESTMTLDTAELELIEI